MDLRAAEALSMPGDPNTQTEAGLASSALSMLDLRIQVAPDTPVLRSEHEALCAQPLAEGVVHYLVLRTETGTRPISVLEVARLGWGVKDAWSAAWALTRTLERPTETNLVDAGRVEVYHLQSTHEFGASFVPFLDDALDDRLVDHGAVVAMPSRRSVLVHPIRGGEVVSAVHAMIPIAHQLHDTAPDSVSAHLYWWQAGHLTWIPTYFGADSVEFYPSKEFADLIDAIDDVI